MRLEQLAAGLAEAEANGVLPGESDARDSRVTTVRTWLSLLGYLIKDNGRSALDEALVGALASFRADAGLPDEPGIGPRSSSLLRRLLAFDPDPLPGNTKRRTFDDLRLDSPAVVRAAHLRLYALDLVERPPDRRLDEKSVARGLESFSRTWSVLGLGELPVGLVPETLRALFDLDRIVLRLRSEEDRLTLTHPAGASSATVSMNRKLAKNLVQAVARIELWLLGYLARPRKRMRAGDSKNESLPAALRHFWADQPEADRPPKSRRLETHGRLFNRIDQLTVVGAPEGPGTEGIEERLLTDADLRKAVRKQMRGLGARVLDGVRRAARFVAGFFRQIKRVVKGMLALAKNIARVVSARAAEAYGVVLEIGAGLAEAWHFLREQPMRGSDPKQMIVMHDKDLDFTVFQHPDADPVQLRRMRQRLHAAIHLFRAATSFVAAMISLFSAITRRAAVAGWFGVVMVVLKLRTRLGAVLETLREVIRWRRALAAA